MPFQTIGSPALWSGFLALVALMLFVDLGLFHRKSHVVGLKEAAAWSVVWVLLAALASGAVYVWFGADRAVEFATGYLIEKALAVDNIFVFVVIFGAFGVPALYQHRVLFWSVLGALAMRAAFVLVGGALLQRFHFLLYVFGALLAVTGVKLFFQRPTLSPADNVVVRAVRRWLPMTNDLHGARFFVRDGGRWLATPLFLALVAIEVTDLVFAVDSIPAIFAVTTGPFIVFTSNIFAILGLRSLYFLLAGVITRFAYLKVGLAAILVFVGAKMLLVDFVKVPVLASLAAIAAILVASVVASLVVTARSAASWGSAKPSQNPTAAA